MSAEERLSAAHAVRMSYRQWLTSQAILSGTPWPLAIEAVSTTALEHPEWPGMDDQRTWAEWESYRP